MGCWKDMNRTLKRHIFIRKLFYTKDKLVGLSRKTTDPLIQIHEGM